MIINTQFLWVNRPMQPDRQKTLNNQTFSEIMGSGDRSTSLESTDKPQNVDQGGLLPSSDHFERWLNTPTKQSSGDEYFWQHQDQLQPSNLHFMNEPLIQQSMPTNIEGKKPLTITKTVINVEKTVLPMPNISAYHQISAAQVLQPNTTQNISIPFILKKNSSLCFLPFISTPQENQLNQLEKSEAIPKFITSDLSINQAESFKNHHLFIKDAQVELTLNTHNLKQHEESELIQMIKDNLKKKGLSLKQIIINGVTYD
ncbi:hypothetical protein EP47_09220 [Legionella norrlandica]|uniref:Uncharacterized protein n=1 Tax=Legionella norrlandica TaxID=1498499 RepID=A0A0A2SRD2_9GAMM|nr:hypothetical protein [Legionella norrlandica]KGP63302.1 hypothetical protein EP47_09220 [Legionella norrlandica]